VTVQIIEAIGKHALLAGAARLAILQTLFVTGLSAALPTQPLLDEGYRQMYSLDFPAAHAAFAEYELVNPADAMGPVSDAVAYLFTEFDRLNILRSDYWLNDKSFFVINKSVGDPMLKRYFEESLARGRQLATAALKGTPDDASALLANTMVLGLHADYLALVDKKNLAALSEMKQSRRMADKLLAVHPQVYDAYIAPGIENYLLSLKPAPVRWILRLAGAETDREAGLRKMRMTAEKGHYFLPYARLLLAIADLRNNNPVDAKEKLTWLAAEYPGNHIFREELAKHK
jgi:hypothetical protein